MSNASPQQETQNKQTQRIKFCEFMLENWNMNFIYVNEVGYSILIPRNRGLSKRGKPVIQKLPLSETPNTSVCMGICRNEIILYRKISTAYDSDFFVFS